MSTEPTKPTEAAPVTPATPATPVTPPTNTPPKAADPGPPAPAQAAPPANPPAPAAPSSLLAPEPEPPPPLPDLELNFPEGISFPKEHLSEFSALAHKHNITKEAAQELVDFQAKLAARQETEFVQQRETWRNEVLSSPEGKEVVVDARRAINKFVEPGSDVHTFLTQTWLGDHPLIIKFLASVGKSLKEDPVTPKKIQESGQGQVEKDPLAAMFPSMVKKTSPTNKR